MRAREFLLEDNPDYDEDRYLKSDPGTPLNFPKGTTLVNVSDVYDWYKLGMAVSDLDDADPRTFNKGVPHTVFAFGSEEEEHKMIPLLKRLGFSLHDIDSPEDYEKAIRADEAIAYLEKYISESMIKIGAPSQRALAWIDKVYKLYPGTFQNNHVMAWGEGDNQQFAMFELVPSMSKRDAVEVKWFQAYPLRRGVGSRAMAELQRLAREDGIALTLYPWDKGQVSQAKLMKFYRAHGFKPTARGSKNMYWEPDLDEAFNQPYQLRWEESPDGESYDALATLDDGTSLSIMFNLEYGGTGDEEWHVEFWRNQSLNVTGEGDAYRIFATVLTAIQKFIQVQRPWRLIFSASKDVEPGQNAQSRAKLYDSLVARYARAWGYDSYNEDHGDQVTYELTRLQNESTDLDEMAGEIHGGIRKVLQDKGYQYLGGGIDKQAWLEPSTGQVLLVFGYRDNSKTFSPDQRMFINWINYCNQHQENPALPRFSGFESFEFRGKKYIQARMERLQHVPYDTRWVVYHLTYDALAHMDIKKAMAELADYAEDDRHRLGGAGPNEKPITVKRAVKMLGGIKQAQNLIQTVAIVKKFAAQHGYRIDLHEDNYMQRPDGTIVVNDPFVVWLES